MGVLTEDPQEACLSIPNALDWWLDDAGTDLVVHY